jgi:hypothetical protein
MGRLELLALGTCGDHAACVYGGYIASSFVVVVDGVPVFLVGAGYGSVRAARHYTGSVPTTVLLLGSDLAQSVDLAPLIIEEGSKGKTIRIVGHAAVLQVVKESLDLQLSDETDEVRDAAAFVAVAAGGAAHVAFGIHAAVPSGCAPGTSRRVTPTTLWAGNPLDDAAVPLAAFTGACRPVQWPPLLIAPLLIAWAVPAPPTGFPSDEFPEDSLWSTVAAIATIERRWNLPRQGTGDTVRFVITGFPSMDTAPFGDRIVTLVPGSCIPLLVCDDALSPFDGMSMAAARRLDGPPGDLDGYDADAHQTDDAASQATRLKARHKHYAPQTAAPVRRVVLASAGVQTDPWTPAAPSSPPRRRTPPQRQTLVGDPRPLSPLAARRLVSPPVARRDGIVKSPNTSRPSSVPSSVVETSLQPFIRPGGGGRSRYRDVTADSDRSSSIPRDPGIIRSADAPPSRPPLSSQRTTEASTAPRTPTAARFSPARAMITTRKVAVFNNEEKGWPGRVLLAHKYPSLDAFVAAASEMCNVRPAARLYHEDGRVVRDVAELGHDARVVLTKKGGTPFDKEDLPRLMRPRRT